MTRRSAPVRTGDVVDVTIDRLATGGRGVARHDGFVLFVARALPGDQVRARVTRVKRSFAEAVAEAVTTPGPTTIDPPCPYVGACGGCAWQRLAYDEQLRVKAEQTREAIERIGGVEEPRMLPIIGASSQLGYRNKVEYTFTQDEVFDTENEQATRTVSLGFHRAGAWDEIVPVDPCLIADERGLDVPRVVAAWANRYGLEAYDRSTGAGLLRTLAVRVGFATGEIQVLVTSTETPDGLPHAAELADDLEADVPGVVGVLHAQVEQGTESTHAAPVELLGGRDWFEEIVCGNRLRVRAGSFLQTNTAMSNRLYEVALELAAPRPDDVVYDLYCGIGSIALAFAPHVASVVGVEVVAEAIECAAENAELNGVSNTDFQVGNVRPVLKFAKGVWPDPTLIVVDPPRAGLVPKVVRRIAEARPERIVYVSCNPTTFAADLPRFREAGYELDVVQPVDQFPHTTHCELVARLVPIPGFEPDPAVVEADAKQREVNRRARTAD